MAPVPSSDGRSVPGGPMEIVFSFDTTGSMGGCIVQVRTQVQEVVTRLFADIPDLRIGVFSHGDYCDGSNITKYIDFSNDVNKLCDFIKNAPMTSGGDYPEAYEVVLRQAQERLSWSPGTNRVLVMIGDAIPHEADFPANKDSIDWKEEVTSLRDELGVKIYGVQCMNNTGASDFYQHLATQTGGQYLKLDDFTSIVDLMMGVCYREHGPEFYLAYENEVRAREGKGLRAGLGDMLVSMRHEPTAAPSTKKVTIKTPPTITTGAKRKAPVKISDGAVKKAKPAPKIRKPVRTGTVKKSPTSHRLSMTPKSRKSPCVSLILPATPVSRSRPDSEGSDISTGSRHSVGSSGGMVTRRRKHQMSLRDTPARRNSRTPLKAPKRLVTPKKSPVASRVLRETILDENFLLENMDWSSWKTAVALNEQRGPAEWVPRRGDHTGYRNFSLFDEECNDPAVYEFSVQTNPGGNKIPVLCKMSDGFTGVNWDAYLLRSDRLQSQVDRVLKRGCKLYVRRAAWKKPVKVAGKNIDSLDELRSLVNQTYDYAWKERYDIPTRRYRQRILWKGDVFISNNN